MIDYLEQTVRDFEGQIEVVTTPFRAAVANLVTIPGISATAAHLVIAENWRRYEQICDGSTLAIVGRVVPAT